MGGRRRRQLGRGGLGYSRLRTCVNVSMVTCVGEGNVGGTYDLLDNVDGVLDHWCEVEGRRRGREGLPEEGGQVLLGVGFEEGGIFTPRVAPGAEVECGVPRLLVGHVDGESDVEDFDNEEGWYVL
jgi:hypothetical protein